MSNELSSVVLFRDFIEDRRTSMDVYADNLQTALRTVVGAATEVRAFTPRPICLSGPGTPPGQWPMRLSRYLAYPFQAFSQQGGINHIVDHGYGHLLYCLDPKRTVVTVHDIIPSLAWRGVIPNRGVPHRPLLGEFSLRAIKRAARVIADSESTKMDLVEYLDFPPGRINVIHIGVADRFRPFDELSRRDARVSFGLPQNTKVILITGWQHYKNHAACVDAFMELCRSASDDVRLVRLGRRTDEWQRMVLERNIGDKVVEIEWLEEDRMIALYNAVDLLLFPSLHEGFGLPPLESMACGTPVVTSNAASLPEIIGDAGLMAAPDDVDAFVRGMKDMLHDKALRNDYIQRGLAQAKRFTWAKCAMDVHSIYLEIAKGT